MNIKSAEFKKGVVAEDDILYDGVPQIAFVGRSNVGKSSVINSLVGKKDMARSSAKPGKTQEINFFLINKSFYLVDLPGYGFAEGSWSRREQIIKLIHWYVQNRAVRPKWVVVIVDAKVGLTENDENMLQLLEETERHVLVVANKIDKLKASELKRSLADITARVGTARVFPYSAEKRIGTGELGHILFS